MHTFGVSTGELDKFSTISVGLKKLVTKPGVPTDIAETASVLAEVITGICALLESFAEYSISAPLAHLESFEQPKNLREAAQALNYIKAVSSPELLNLYKTMFVRERGSLFCTETFYKKGRLHRLAGTLADACNAEGLRQVGIAYTTSALDLAAITHKKALPLHGLNAVVLKEDSPIYNLTYAADPTSEFFIDKYQLSVPIVIV